MELPLTNKIIVYAVCLGIAGCIGAAAMYKFRPPRIEEREVVKVETKIETKEVVKWRDRVVERVITKPDGTVITEKEKVKDGSTSNTDTKTDTKVEERIVIKDASRFSLGVRYDVVTSNGLSNFRSFDLTRLFITGSTNLFGPVELNAATNIQWPPTVSIGFSWRF